MFRSKPLLSLILAAILYSLCHVWMRLPRLYGKPVPGSHDLPDRSRRLRR